MKKTCIIFTIIFAVIMGTLLNGSAILAPAQPQLNQTANREISKLTRVEYAAFLAKLAKLEKSCDENGEIPLSPITIENSYHYPEIHTPAPAGKDYIIRYGTIVHSPASSKEEVLAQESAEIKKQLLQYQIAYEKYQADMQLKVQALAAAQQEENRMREFKLIMDHQAQLMARDLARSTRMLHDYSQNAAKQKVEIERNHIDELPEDEARSPLMEPTVYKRKNSFQSSPTRKAAADRLAVPMLDSICNSSSSATSDKRKYSLPLLNIPFRQTSPAHSPERGLACQVIKEIDEESFVASSSLTHPKIASPTLSAAAAAAVSTRDFLASAGASPMQSMRKLPFLIQAGSQSGLQTSPSKHTDTGLRTPRRRLHQKYKPADSTVEGRVQPLQNQLINQNAQATQDNAHCDCSCVIQ